MTAVDSLTHEVAASLLEKIEDRHDIKGINSLRGGRNNRVWRLDTQRSTFLLKQYFTHPSDPRDRLARETEFLNAARSMGCKQVPACIAVDPSKRIALLEWIDGDVPAPESINASAVDQAATFIGDLNCHRERVNGLQPASEACFALPDHIQLVEQRIKRLEQFNPVDSIDWEFDSFVHDSIRPTWARVSALLKTGSCVPLPASEHCVSPSDFGFHNSLRTAAGHLKFVDFEYAGWDDPAKLICDFANQPDMLLADSLSDRFRQAVTRLFPNPGALSERIRLLEPVLQVKWACICLNAFLAAGRDRTRFTDAGASDLQVRKKQLDKATQMLARAKRTF